jgi:hypothetical protein
MNYFQRSSQVWSVLVMAARTQHVVSYDMLARMTGIARFGFAHILGNIYHYCEQQGMPPLTAIVIDEKSGKPAADVFQSVDVPSAHARVFVFDWISHDVPSVQDFERARETAEAAKAAAQVA